MRISDWSSDVCSSDLLAIGATLSVEDGQAVQAGDVLARVSRVAAPDNPAIIDSHGWVLYRLGRNEEAVDELRRAFAMQKEIGRASCRESVWQYVEVSGVAVALKKKQQEESTDN